MTLILLFFSKFQEEEEDLVESEEDEIKPNGVNSSHNKAWRKTSKDYFFCQNGILFRKLFWPTLRKKNVLKNRQV